MRDRSVKRAGEPGVENAELSAKLCAARAALEETATAAALLMQVISGQRDMESLPVSLEGFGVRAKRALADPAPSCPHQKRAMELETALAAEQGAHAETMRALARDANANMSYVPRVESALHAQLRAALDALCIAERDLKDSRTLHAEMRKERDELQAILDKQSQRIVEAINLWKIWHPGNDAWPDLGGLIDWLIENSTLSELLPCPKCASQSVGAVIDNDLTSVVRCYGCGHLGVRAGIYCDAVRTWNAEPREQTREVTNEIHNNREEIGRCGNPERADSDTARVRR